MYTHKHIKRTQNTRTPDFKAGEGTVLNQCFRQMGHPIGADVVISCEPKQNTKQNTPSITHTNTSACTTYSIHTHPQAWMPARGCVDANGNKSTKHKNSQPRTNKIHEGAYCRCMCVYDWAGVISYMGACMVAHGWGDCPDVWYMRARVHQHTRIRTITHNTCPQSRLKRWMFRFEHPTSPYSNHTKYGGSNTPNITLTNHLKPPK